MIIINKDTTVRSHAFSQKAMVAANDRMVVKRSNASFRQLITVPQLQEMADIQAQHLSTL